MQKNSLQHYRDRLLEMRDRLTGEINRMIEAVHEDARPPGEHDKSPSEAVDKETTLEKNEVELRRAVAAALERLDDGTYGGCERCGEKISATRLDAVPYTAYCVDCEHQIEQKQR